jgi:hypothetical protein
MLTRSFAMLIHTPEFLHTVHCGNRNQAFVEFFFSGLILIPKLQFGIYLSSSLSMTLLISKLMSNKI